MEKAESILNGDLKELSACFQANKFSLNQSEIKIIVFKSKSNYQDRNINKTVENTHTEKVKQTNFLAVLIDKLSLQSHMYTKKEQRKLSFQNF